MHTILILLASSQSQCIIPSCTPNSKLSSCPIPVLTGFAGSSGSPPWLPFVLRWNFLLCTPGICSSLCILHIVLQILVWMCSFPITGLPENWNNVGILSGFLRTFSISVCWKMTCPQHRGSRAGMKRNHYSIFHSLPSFPLGQVLSKRDKKDKRFPFLREDFSLIRERVTERLE